MSPLPERTDVVIVGGGITGTALAYYLSGDLEVLLLERHTVASGPTGHSTAIVRAHYSQRLLVEMAVLGLAVYGDFAHQVGGSCGFVRSGVLWLVGDEDRAALEDNVALGARAGAAVRLLEPKDLRAIDGRIALDGLAGACWEPEGGYCDPYLAAAGFAQAARQRGAIVHEQTPVLVVESGAVETAAGEVRADAVVVAAGPWTPALLEPLGYRLPITPARAEVGRYRIPTAFGPPPPVLAEMGGARFYTKPGEAGFIEVGTLDPAHAHQPIDPDRCPEGAEPATLVGLERALTARIPTLAGGHWRGAWSGVYDVTPDWQPAIGPIQKANGVYVAAGFSGHGFKLAPAVGRSLATHIRERRWDPFDLSLLDPSRFDRGELIESRYGFSVVG
ncbi:MAG: NAD(P)/FAD-dependent oxidoreductase [Gaiellaceae bacterium]